MALSKKECDDFISACKSRDSLRSSLFIQKLSNSNQINDRFINANGEEDLMPLHIAILNGDVQSVELLIERGADLNAQDLFGDTPLHISCLIDNVELAEMLLVNGADPNILVKSGSTLFYTTHKMDNDYYLTKLLIKHGADVNFIHESGRPALFDVLCMDSPRVAEILCENGAQITPKILELISEFPSTDAKVELMEFVNKYIEPETEIERR